MLINEDYFNNIDIEEDDIKNTDIVEKLTPEEYYEYCKSHYSQTIVIHISDVLKYNQTWVVKTMPDILTELSKKIHYLFNIFDIEYSDIVCVENVSEKKEIVDCGEYKMMINPEWQINYIRDKVIIYVNYPKIYYKRALLLAQKLQDIVFNYKNPDRYKVFEVISLYKFVVDPRRIIYAEHLELNSIMYKKDWTVKQMLDSDRNAYIVNAIVEYFCGEKVERQLWQRKIL